MSHANFCTKNDYVCRIVVSVLWSFYSIIAQQPHGIKMISQLSILHCFVLESLSLKEMHVYIANSAKQHCESIAFPCP